MQDEDTTVFNFGKRANELMTALSAAGLRGMSAAQADLVVAQQRIHPPEAGQKGPHDIQRHGGVGMIYGSVCSGIEAASVAWHPLGWRAAWLAEIEAFPTAVLAHHFPDVPNLGDMTKLAKLVLTGKIAAPDVLVGGTPCQAFSVAGLREGLSDPRGQLTIKYVELFDAIDHVRVSRGDDPAIAVWENVPGVLSDKGNAFGCLLGALSGEDFELQPPGGKWANAGCVFGPQRAVAWRILDAQYFGLAQRRRRVFVVASARAGFNPAQVLFEFGGLRRDTPPRRGKGPTVAALTANGVGTCGADDNQGQAGHLIPTGSYQCACGHIFDHSLGKYGCPNCEGESGPAQEIPAAGCWWDGGQVSQTLDAVLSKGQTMPEKNRFPAVLQPIAYSSSGAGYWRDGIGPLRAREQDSHENLIDFHPTQDPISSTDGTTHAMGCGSSGGQASIAIAVRTAQTGSNGWGVNEETAYTLDRAQGQAVAMSVALRGREGGATAELGDEVGGCLRASGGGGDKAHVLAPVAFPIQEVGKRTGQSTTDKRAGIGIGAESDPMFTLQAGAQHGVAHEMAVRRLTPRECERLQGFPDDWTLVPVREKPAADGPRYKALGNSMAVPVMRWIGERIQMVCDYAKQSYEVTA